MISSFFLWISALISSFSSFQTSGPVVTISLSSSVRDRAICCWFSRSACKAAIAFSCFSACATSSSDVSRAACCSSSAASRSALRAALMETASSCCEVSRLSGNINRDCGFEIISSSAAESPFSFSTAVIISTDSSVRGFCLYTPVKSAFRPGLFGSSSMWIQLLRPCTFIFSIAADISSYTTAALLSGA